MNRTILILAVACQMAAGAAFAQTDTTATTTGGTDAGAMAGTYGSDWSLSLGPSLFGEDGTTLRTDAELTTQWQTLSEDDRAMLRRDCLAHSNESGDTTGAAATTGTTADAATTDTTAGATANADASSPMMVSSEQMERICMAVKDL